MRSFAPVNNWCCDRSQTRPRGVTMFYKSVGGPLNWARDPFGEWTFFPVSERGVICFPAVVVFYWIGWSVRDRHPRYLGKISLIWLTLVKMLTPSDHCRIRWLFRHFDHSLFNGGNLLTYFNIVRAELQLVEVWRRNCRGHHYSNPSTVWDVGHS